MPAAFKPAVETAPASFGLVGQLIVEVDAGDVDGSALELGLG